MAKKKVKTKASLLAATAAASVNESIKYDNVRDHNNNKNTDVNGDIVLPYQSSTDKVGILTARLKTVVGKSSSLHKQSRVILTSSDALQLDVAVGDDVIILSFDNNIAREGVNFNSSKRVKAIAILPIEIYTFPCDIIVE